MKTVQQGLVAFGVLTSGALLVGAAEPSPTGAGSRGGGSPRPLEAQAVPGDRDEAAPLDTSQCWKRCKDCEGRCSKKSGDDKRNCEENCHDGNATCCEAGGKKGTYKMCGCN